MAKFFTVCKLLCHSMMFLAETNLLFSPRAYSLGPSASYNFNQPNLKKADRFARETAAWFQYTTGPMKSEHLGQCGDYAVMFVLKYNNYAG